MHGCMYTLWKGVVAAHDGCGHNMMCVVMAHDGCSHNMTGVVTT